MKCDACGSETPPHYQHGLLAVICHTCKVLGRVVEAAFSHDSVEPEMPASEIEAAKPAETVKQPAAPDTQAEQAPESSKVEESAPDPQVAQVADQEPTGSTEQNAEQEAPVE